MSVCRGWTARSLLFGPTSDVLSLLRRVFDIRLRQRGRNRRTRRVLSTDFGDTGRLVYSSLFGVFDARVQVLESCVSGFLDDSQTGSCLQGADLPVFGLQAQTYYIMVEGTALNQYGDFSIEILPLLEPCPEPSTLKSSMSGVCRFWIGKESPRPTTT